MHLKLGINSTAEIVRKVNAAAKRYAMGKQTWAPRLEQNQSRPASEAGRIIRAYSRYGHVEFVMLSGAKLNIQTGDKILID